MRIARFDLHDGRPRLGAFTQDGIADISDRLDWADALAPGGQVRLHATTDTADQRHDVAAVRLLPPIPPGARVFCVGLNYLKRHPIAGTVVQRPVQPTIFVKVNDSFIGHGQDLRLPGPLSEQLDYECELAVVIGRAGRHIKAAAAFEHVWGYTILNDGSVRDWQKHSLFSGKNFALSSSCGPAIVTAEEVGDPQALTLATRLNGEIVQKVSTGEMLYDVAALISHVSAFTPLQAGDLIATGSPEGSGGSRDPQRFLRAGDRLEFEIERIGTLCNGVAA